MGIGKPDLDLLLRLKERGYLPDGASVIEIGAQQLSNSFLEARDAVDELGQMFSVNVPFSLTPTLSSTVSGGVELLNGAAPLARDFWRWLGFRYASVDIDGSPDSLPLDLNYDDAPLDAIGKYDLVTNFGTTEHIANQLNVFKIIHDLTALNEVMLHNVPALGMLNHGLVNYNPKFFWMLARSNGYKFLFSDYVGSPIQHGLPKDIIDNIISFNTGIAGNADEFQVPDAGLTVVLQKLFNSSFVAPLDVETGSKPVNKTFADRYWSIYTADAFEHTGIKATVNRWVDAALRPFLR